ncbi:coat protein [Vibrio phage 1.183.O._10N.286.48.B7]|nr:coat protein [Vibrio phage 1.183.O._10N.286.48.B7]
MAVQNNNLLTDDVIAKEALRLLKNNLVTAKLVYRNYEKTFGKVGDTIRLKLPYRVKAADGRTLVKQPMVDQTIPFKIDKQHHVGLEYTVKDKTLDIMDFSERYLKSGMIQIANKIDRNILLTLKKAFHTSGTPGVRPGKFIDFANAGAKQTTYAVPQDGMRHAVLDPFTCASLSDEVTKLFKESMVEQAYKMGYRGKVSEYDTYESQNLPKHTVGDHGGTPLAGAGDNGSVITMTGGTASTTGFLKVGDVFTVAGVFGVNPQNYETTGLLQEFVVTADVDTDGAGAASISVFPALNDGTATINNAEGDPISTKAYQNITALPVAGAAITIAGAANATYEQNYLFHRDAIALAMIDLELPQSAVIKSRAADPETGLSLTLTGAYDINEQTEIHRIDAVYGTDLIYGELALRMWGAAQ